MSSKKPAEAKRAALPRAADFSNAFMRFANLFQSDMSGAIFDRADMAGAFLEETKLDGARMFRTNASGVQLNRASLKNADLREEYLKAVRHGLAFLRDKHRDPLSGGYFWTLRDGQPEALAVNIGASNGRQTEITGGDLKVGMAVITDYQETKK